VTWGAEDDAPADIGESAADIDAAAVEVDVADPQGGGLAPAQAGVGQDQDEQPPAARLAGQRQNLGVSEKDVIAAHCPDWPLQRQGHPKIVPNRFAETIFRTHP
jgi:hypothetical protein